MMETLPEIEKMMKENGGKYLVFENGKPKLLVLDAEKYPNLVVEGGDEKKKILVTGGAGYIGSHTVARLMEDGYDVLVYDNLSSGNMKFVPCTLIVGDVNDTQLLDKVFRDNKIEAVIHFAGSIVVEESVKNPQKYFNNNVLGSLNLLNCMVRHGVDKMVYSSSAAVYGTPKEVPIKESHPTIPVNPYGESKLFFEKILGWYFQAFGINSVAFRYFNAAGACPKKGLGELHLIETHLIPKVLSVANKEEESLKIFGYDYPTPDGTAVRDYIHVDDLARAHVLALDKLKNSQGSFVYNLGTGHGYSVKEIVDMVIEITGKMVTIEKVERRAGDPPVLVADATKVKDQLGFETAQSDLRTIISSAWEWHKIRPTME